MFGSRKVFGSRKSKNKQQDGISKTSTAQQFQLNTNAIDYNAAIAEFDSWDEAPHLTQEDESVFEVEWGGYDGLFLGATVRYRGLAHLHLHFCAPSITVIVVVIPRARAHFKFRVYCFPVCGG